MEARALLSVVSYWQFDEGSGTIALDSAGTNAGTLLNGPTWTTGIVGGALRFDGLDDYVSVPDSPSLDLTTAMTTEAWVKFDSVDNRYETILSKVGDNDTDFESYSLRRYRTDGSGASWMGKLASDIITTSGLSQVHSTFVPTAGHWYHVVGTYDGSMHKLYVNGQLEGAAAHSGSLRTSSQPLWIGRLGHSTEPELLDGTLDEVAIYNRVLSDEEIRQHANRPPVVELPADAIIEPGSTFAGTGRFEDADSTSWTATVDYGDGSGVQSLALNADKTFSLNHAYPNEGQHTVTVTVDDASRMGSDSLLVGVGTPADLVAPPVAWYSGESGDDLVGNNDGAIQGNVTFVDGKVGKAFAFDGQSAINVYKRSNVFEPGAGDFTVESWVKMAPGDSGTLLYNYGGLQRYALYISPARQVGFVARDGGGVEARIEGQTALDDNQWHHVAGVRQGSAFSVYVDGVPDATPIHVAVGSVNPPTSYVRIGGARSGPGFDTSPTANEGFFTGLIDELSYFPRALGQEELQRIVTAANAGKALPGPVAWYSGESGDDLVGNNDGALQGNVQFVPGVVGNALSLDGQSAINVYKRSNAFEPGAGDFAYEGWVKFDGTNQTGHRVLAFNYGPAYHAIYLYVSPSHHFGFAARDGSNREARLDGQTALGDNQWHHVAAIRRGATFSVYVDGLLDGSLTDPTVGAVAPSNPYFRIGGGNSGPGHETSPTANESFFTGLIDELSYFPRALSQWELLEIIDAGGAGKELPGPAAWYSGESGDDLVGNNDGARQGNVQFVPGVVGNALSFDGQSAINVYKRSNAFDPAAGDFAYEAWIKFDGTNQTGYHSLVFNYGGVPYHALFISPNHRLDFVARDGSGHEARFEGQTALGDNQWHHVAAMRRGATFSVFVDGSLDGSLTAPTVGSIVTSSSYLRIGGGNSGLGHETSPTANENFFTGLIDEFKYYPRAHLPLEGDAPPTLDAIADPAAIDEDAGLQTVNLSGISAGGGESQLLQVTAASSNTALIPDPTVSYTSPSTTGSLSYTPVANQSGTAVITVTARDTGLDGILGTGDDGTAQQSFAVTVNPVNDPPILDPIGNKSIDEEQTLSFTVTASDPQDSPPNVLTFSAAGLPPGASLDPVTGVFTWTPTEAQGPGSYPVTFTVTESSSSVVLADNPVAYWRLGEASGGTAIDSSGHGHNAAYYGPTLGQDGVAPDDTAILFHASEADLMQYGSDLAPGGGSWSVEAWINVPPSSLDRTIIQYYPGGYTDNHNSVWGLYVSSTGVPSWGVRDRDAHSLGILSTQSVADNQWHQVVAVLDRSSSRARLYVDGVEMVSTDASSIGSISDTGYPVNIGWSYAYWTGGRNYFDGLMDELTIYDSALSASRVLSHYQAASQGLGEEDSESIVITVNEVNDAPEVGFSLAGSTIDEGDAVSGSGSFVDPSSTAWTATVDYGDGSGDQTLVLDPGLTFTLCHVYEDDGEYTVTVTVTDNLGASGAAEQLVTVNNVAPTVAITGAPASSPEGTAITLGSTVSDPGADTYTHAWSVTKDGVPYDSGTSASFSFTPDDNGSYAVSLTVTDDDGGATDQYLYDFENLATGGLIGQDGWFKVGSESWNKNGWIMDDGAGPESGLGKYLGPYPGRNGVMLRYNDANWSYTIPDDADFFVFEFDARNLEGGGHWIWENGQWWETYVLQAGIGPLTIGFDSAQRFAVWSQAGSYFASNATSSAGESWHIKAAADLTANAGAGGVSLFARNVTQGGTLDPVAGLQNVPIGSFSRSDFNQLYVRLQSGARSPLLDNLQITVGDPTAGTGTAGATIDVTNVAPDFELGLDEVLQLYQAGALSRLDIPLTDPGADVWTGTVDYGDGAGAQPLAIDQLAKAFDLAHTYTANGVYTVSVTIDDGDGASHTDHFDVDVWVNTPPALASPIPDVAVNEDAADTAIDLFAAFTDAQDADENLTYAVESNTNPGLFAGITINGAAGTLTLAYAADAHGTADFSVRATDSGGLYVEDTFTVTINPVNDAPKVVHPIDDVTVDEDADSTVIDLSGVFVDPEGDSFTFSVSSSDPALVTATVNSPLTLNYAQDGFGSATITVTATDSTGESMSDSFTVTVRPVNDAPVLTPASITTNEDTPVTIDLRTLVTDVDTPLDSLSFQVGDAVNGTVTMVDAYTALFDPAEDYNGMGSFSYLVTDPGRPGGLLADSLAEFSGVQGQDNWYYGYAYGQVGPYNPTAFTQLPVFSGHWQWLTYYPPSTWIGSYWQHPAAQTFSGWSDTMVIRRWVSEVSGDLTIDFDVAKIVQPGVGNGVHAYVLRNGVVLWDQYFGPYDATVVPRSLNVSGVSVGDFIEFAVGPNGGSDQSDVTSFTSQIRWAAQPVTVGPVTVEVTVTPENDAADVIVSLTASSIDEGGVITGSGSFTDPDPDTWTATVDYGDGSGVQPLPLNPDKTFALDHVYADDGQYSVLVTVTDSAEASGSAAQVVTASNVAPTIALTGDASVPEGTPYTLTLGAVTDPGADTVSRYIVHWGDGNSDSYAGPGDVTHTYANGLLNPPSAGPVQAALTTTQDTFITDAAGLGGPNSTHGQDGGLWSINYFTPGGGGSLATRPMFDFNLTSYAGKTATGGATFRAYLAGPDNPVYYHPDSRRVDLYQITSPWDAGTASWNTQPGIAFVASSSIQFLGDHRYEEWTIAQGTVQSWLSNPASFHGLMIVNELPDAFVYDLVFASLEHAENKPAQLDFRVSGPTTITVDLEDEDGIHPDAGRVTVRVDNVAPSFELGPDVVLQPFEAGALSRLDIPFTDPGADVWSGTVDCGDGSGEQPLAIDQLAKTFDLAHRYSKEGNFIVAVTIRDGDGANHTDTFNVQVLFNAPPLVIDPIPDITVHEDAADTLIDLFAAFEDAQDTDRDLTYTIQSNTYTSLFAATSVNGVAGTLTLDYAADLHGTADFVVRATDSGGLYVDDTFTVTVLAVNDAPTVVITGVPFDSPEGAAIPLGTIVTDPDASDTYAYAWSVTKDGAAYVSGSGANFSFTPDDNGSYVVNLTVTDDAGGTGTATSTTINVTNVTPNASVSGPPAGFRNLTQQFVLSASDTSSVDLASPFTFQIDWDGDGIVDDTVTEPIGTEVTHVYASAGNYTVSVTATDKDNARSAAVTHVIAIEIIEPDDLAGIIEDLDPNDTTVTLDDVHPSNLRDFIQAIADLPPRSAGDPVIEIVINLDHGNFGLGRKVAVPAGYRLVINGMQQVVIEGSSPALTLSSGDLVAAGDLTFSTTTDHPTILVEGGSLSLRNSTVRETSGGDRTAIEILGGRVDLGATGDAGGNIFDVYGAGQAIRNFGLAPVSALGNTFQIDGAGPISNFDIEDRILHALDPGGGGLVTTVENNVYVTIDEATLFTVNLRTLVADVATAGVDFAIAAADHGTAMIQGDGATAQFAPSDNGSASFVYTASVGGMPVATRTVNLRVLNLPDVAGFVFDDLDNDGQFEPGNGEAGIAGVTLTLTGTDDRGPVSRTATTAGDGSYSFADLRPGAYALSEVQPADFLDGGESLGSLGGVANNLADSNVIDQIMAQLGDADSGGYDFGEIRPSDIQGLVWEDFSNDGQVNFGEQAIAGATVELTGTDDRGHSVSRSVVADADGIYMFIDLRPGNYTVNQSQPAGFQDGKDTLGTVNNVPTGDASVNDRFSNVYLPRPASVAENYNFGERPQSSSTVTAGQTATIGFWQNKNGQELIRSLGGGAASTGLGDWLAATFPNMYGASAGANNLIGRTNAEVAGFYQELFLRKQKEAVQLRLGGPAKLDAQVLAVAFAAYVTNQTLAGTTAAEYGFLVTEHGVGVATFNIGDDGLAFGVADHSDLTVLDILLATNERTMAGVLYDHEGDGDADDDLETLLRTLAIDVYSAINKQGGV